MLSRERRERHLQELEEKKAKAVEATLRRLKAFDSYTRRTISARRLSNRPSYGSHAMMWHMFSLSSPGFPEIGEFRASSWHGVPMEVRRSWEFKPPSATSDQNHFTHALPRTCVSASRSCCLVLNSFLNH